MAGRANDVHAIADVLADKLPEELGKRYQWTVKVMPTGYNGYIRVIIVSNYFRRINDPGKRNLIIDDILCKYLPKPSQKITQMAACTPAEYRRWYDKEREDEEFQRKGVILSSGMARKASKA